MKQRNNGLIGCLLVFTGLLAACTEMEETSSLTKEQVKECLRRPRRKARKEQERVPKRRGRPAKQIPTTLSALEKEVKQLRMENELLRDFLKATERK